MVWGGGGPLPRFTETRCCRNVLPPRGMGIQMKKRGTLILWAAVLALACGACLIVAYSYNEGRREEAEAARLQMAEMARRSQEAADQAQAQRLAQMERDRERERTAPAVAARQEPSAPHADDSSSPACQTYVDCLCGIGSTMRELNNGSSAAYERQCATQRRLLSRGGAQMDRTCRQALEANRESFVALRRLYATQGITIPSSCF